MKERNKKQFLKINYTPKPVPKEPQAEQVENNNGNIRVTLGEPPKPTGRIRHPSEYIKIIDRSGSNDNGGGGFMARMIKDRIN